MAEGFDPAARLAKAMDKIQDKIAQVIKHDFDDMLGIEG